MNWPLLILLSLAGYEATKLFKLNNAGNELSVSIGQVAVSKIENVALKMWAEVWYDNFTDLPLKIQQPTVKVFLTDSSGEIGHAIPSTEITDVPAHGRNGNPCTVWFTIPLSNIPFAITALLAGEKANRKIIVEIRAEVNGFTYKDSTEYTI